MNKVRNTMKSIEIYPTDAAINSDEIRGSIMFKSSGINAEIEF